MRKLALFALFTVFTLVPAMSARAQVGVFTHRGPGIIAHAQMGEDLLQVGVMPSYVIHPTIEVAAGVSRHTATCEGCNYGAWYLTPAVFFYPVRQNASIPVTVYLTALANFIAVDDAPEGEKKAAWGSGIGISRKFEGASMSLTPVVEFLYKGVNTGNGPSLEVEHPLYYMFALHASMDSGAGTAFIGPFFQGYSRDGQHGQQFGIRAGLTLD